MKKLQKGFTLVELMIVVAIIAILAAVALPSFGQQIKKSKDGKAVQMMGSMRSQLGMVTADLGGENPTVGSALNVFLSGNIAGDATSNPANATSKGLQGFGKLGTFVAAGTGTLNAGSPSVVNTAYTIVNELGSVNFTASGNDTKGSPWTNY